MTYIVALHNYITEIELIVNSLKMNGNTGFKSVFPN